MTIAHLFSWTDLTRPKNEVITFFLLCLASIDATLTAIVGDRLLPYWYSTIAAGGICVPTPTHGKMSNLTSHDAVIYAANDLITALTTPQPTNSVLSIGNDQTFALRKLATIFQGSIKQKQQSIACCGAGGTRHCTTTTPTHPQSN